MDMCEGIKCALRKELPIWVTTQFEFARFVLAGNVLHIKCEKDSLALEVLSSVRMTARMEEIASAILGKPCKVRVYDQETVERQEGGIDELLSEARNMGIDIKMEDL